MVSATVVGCAAQPDGGWVATFSVVFAGGSRWTVEPEYGAAQGGGDTWQVSINDKDATAQTVSLTTVKVSGGAPFTSVQLRVPKAPIIAACPG